jgi:simple sugar transport system ATP-binding protein
MPTTAFPAVELRGITKRFGSLTANDRVDFAVQAGEIHGLLGENGAGKSTLMRILYGLYTADEGEIRVAGRPVAIRSPKDAIAAGIGMVTQHFALVGPLTVAENVILGHKGRFALNPRAAEQQVGDAARRFGIDVDPQALVKTLSVGQRQRVEILKALYHNARLLILDEPTAVLLPQEAEQLFANLRQLRAAGLSVVFISHKLHEVTSITDRVTVLRLGKVAGSRLTEGATRQELASLMVGRELVGLSRRTAAPTGATVLTMTGVMALNGQGAPALRGLDLTVRAGEIVGVAGVSGNGQVELAQVLDGTRTITGGTVTVNSAPVVTASVTAGPAEMMAAGIGRIPEDRHASVVGEMSVAQNLALEHLHEFTRGGRLDHRAIRRHAETLIAAYQIKAQPDDRIRTLSGGNIQKCILARVIERNPQLIVVAQPTRGLDIGATEYVRNKLLEQRQRGAAILLFSEDLEELLELADRIAVIYDGRILADMPVAAATTERLGLLMAGIT